MNKYRDYLQIIYSIWTAGFFEMHGFLTRMLVREWRIAVPIGLLVGLSTGMIAHYLGSDACILWGVLLAAVSALIQCLVIPLVIAWSMQKSFEKHYDMNPHHMKAVWTGGSSNESTMLVAATAHKPVGVVAVLAGPAKLAMTALRAVRTRGPLKAAPLFGTEVQAAARLASTARHEPYLPCSVFRVSVDSCVRGQGVGRRLMAAAEEWATAHGYTHVELTTASPTAIRFYERLGYSVHYTKLSILEFRVVHMRKQIGVQGGAGGNDSARLQASE